MVRLIRQIVHGHKVRSRSRSRSLCDTCSWDSWDSKHCAASARGVGRGRVSVPSALNFRSKSQSTAVPARVELEAHRALPLGSHISTHGLMWLGLWPWSHTHCVIRVYVLAATKYTMPHRTSSTHEAVDAKVAALTTAFPSISCHLAADAAAGFARAVADG